MQSYRFSAVSEKTQTPVFMRLEGSFRTGFSRRNRINSGVENPKQLIMSHMGVSGERISPDFALSSPRPPYRLPSLTLFTFAEYVGTFKRLCQSSPTDHCNLPRLPRDHTRQSSPTDHCILPRLPRDHTRQSSPTDHCNLPRLPKDHTRQSSPLTYIIKSHTTILTAPDVRWWLSCAGKDVCGHRPLT